MSESIVASCACGRCRIEIARPPSRRLYCHCTICQKVYDAPFADVTILPASAITLPEGSPIVFRRHKTPPAIQRGTCPDCHRPIVGFMTYAPGMRVAYVPAEAFRTEPPDVPPSLHVFYKTRSGDVQDDLPKYSGTLVSLLAGTPVVLGAFFRK